MRQDVRSPQPTATPTSSNTSSPRPDTDLHTRLGSLVAYVRAVATMMSPEAAVALAYGVPSLETDELVRFLNERRREA